MGTKECDIQRGPEQYPLFLSKEFKDYAKRCQAEGAGPITYAKVVMIQWIRRHPKLTEKIEAGAGKFGIKINLNQPND